MSSKERLPVVDILTLMATILVVMGHHKFLRDSISWYTVYDKIIYSFHMGFFMTISGFLIRYTYSPYIKWREYVGKKVKKFVPAYFIVGLIAACLSFESIQKLEYDLLMLFIYPGNGPIQIIWYIYVLLMFYCIAPFVYRLSTKQRWWLLAVSIIPASFAHYIPPYFNLLNFVRLSPFFLLGAQIADNYKILQSIVDWKILLMSIPFMAFLICCIVTRSNPLRGDLGKLVSSALSLPLMYWIARKMVRVKTIIALSFNFSPYVFAVYLWQNVLY